MIAKIIAHRMELVPKKKPDAAISLMSPPPKPPGISKVSKSIGTDTASMPINLSVILYSGMRSICTIPREKMMI